MRKKSSKAPKKPRNDTSIKAKAVAVKKKRANAKPKLPKEGNHLGIQYDSYNEYHTICWLKELQDRGYVISFKRAQTYELTDGWKHTYKDEKGKRKSQTILMKSVYTPEFEVIWHPEYYSKIVWLAGTESKYDKPLIGHINEEGDIFTIIECKSDGYDRNNMVRLFVSNAKWIFSKYGIYVNLVKPEEFFSNCFFPESFLKTATGLDRRLKCVPVMIDEYLNK